MNITQLKQSLPYLKKAGLVPNIIGKHGIGKSSIIKQFAEQNGYSYHPFFLGQMSDTADMLGLPEFDRDEKGKAISTSFVHPAKLPKKQRSILHFDELNHSPKDLINGMFQLALEGSFHDYELPNDSMLITSMNPPTDDYGGPDYFANKAFADRFVHINLDPTHEEFHDYMKGRYGFSPVSEFLRQQTKLLEESDLQPVTIDFVKPSRRSWDRLQKLELTGMPENLFRECGMGIVGTAAMVAYSSWKETQVTILNGKDILDNYPNVRDKYLGYFTDLNTGKPLDNYRTDMISSVCSSLSEEFMALLKAKTVEESQAINFTDFLNDTPLEYAYATLINFRFIPEFTMNSVVKKIVLHNKPLIDKIKEAKIAKDKYEETKKDRSK